MNSQGAMPSGRYHSRVDSRHVPTLSNPKLVIEVIRAAANA